MKRLSLVTLILGIVLFAGGAGMRVYANVSQRLTESRLIAAKPASPDVISASAVQFSPADGQPSLIQLSALDLWNRLEPVQQQVAFHDGRLALAWDVKDAGWHDATRPGSGFNVVIAGHSPSLDPAVWSRSIFRQLAYLNPGDLIQLTAGSHLYIYTVDRVFAVTSAEAETAESARWLAPGTAEQLTLITCWPPNTAAYRIVVIALPFRVEERTYHESDPS